MVQRQVICFMTIFLVTFSVVAASDLSVNAQTSIKTTASLTVKLFPVGGQLAAKILMRVDPMPPSTETVNAFKSASISIIGPETKTIEPQSQMASQDGVIYYLHLTKPGNYTFQLQFKGYHSLDGTYYESSTSAAVPLELSLLQLNPTKVPSPPVVNGDFWTEKAPLPHARSSLGTAVVDGKIYALGGRDGNNIFGLNQQYDPATNAWVDKAPMPTPRFDFAVAVYEGKIYCIGGKSTFNYYLGGLNYSLSTANEVYDPSTDTWTNQAPMPQGSDGQANIVNGKIYVLSGEADPSIRLTQVYDPASNQWSARTPMPGREGYSSASAAVGDKIYVFGGVSHDPAYDIEPNYNIAQIYDTAKDVWSLASSPPVYMGGNIAAAITINDDSSPKIALIGLTGYASTEGDGSTVTQLYDPNTDSWIVGASMSTSRQKFGLALLDNQIYVIGGSIPYYPYAPDDVGGSTLYFAANERYTLGEMPTITPTFPSTPVSNSTESGPSGVQSQVKTPLEAITIGIVIVVIVLVALTVLWVIRKRKPK